MDDAALTPFEQSHDITRADLEQVFAVDCCGVFECIPAVLPDTTDAGWGRIVDLATPGSRPARCWA